MTMIPEAVDTDTDDVAWALQTARSLWQRGEQEDALTWLRRAAQIAREASDDARALELARVAATIAQQGQASGQQVLPSGVTQASGASGEIGHDGAGSDGDVFSSAPSMAQLEGRAQVDGIGNPAVSEDESFDASLAAFSTTPPIKAPTLPEPLQPPPPPSQSSQSFQVQQPPLPPPPPSQSSQPFQVPQPPPPPPSQSFQVPQPPPPPQALQPSQPPPPQYASQPPPPPQYANQPMAQPVFGHRRGPVSEPTAELEVEPVSDPADATTEQSSAQVTDASEAGQIAEDASALVVGAGIEPHYQRVADKEDELGMPTVPSPPPKASEIPGSVPDTDVLEGATRSDSSEGDMSERFTAKSQRLRPPPAPRISPQPVGDDPVEAGSMRIPVSRRKRTYPSASLSRQLDAEQGSMSTHANEGETEASQAVSVPRPSPSRDVRGLGGEPEAGQEAMAPQTQRSMELRDATVPDLVSDPAPDMAQGMGQVSERVEREELAQVVAPSEAAQVEQVARSTEVARSSDTTNELSQIAAFSAMSDEAREQLASEAQRWKIGVGDEVSEFGLVCVISGQLDVMAMVTETSVGRLQAGQVLRSRGTVQDELALRVVGACDESVVLVWTDEVVADRLASLPWVEETLRTESDMMHGLIGMSLGAMGDGLESEAFAQLVQQLSVAHYVADQQVIERGEAVLALMVVGVGQLELQGEGSRVEGEFQVGDVVFAEQLVTGGTAPKGVRAGERGALLLKADEEATRGLIDGMQGLREFLTQQQKG